MMKHKQEMHVYAQDLCIIEALNPLNILLLKVQRLNLTFIPALAYFNFLYQRIQKFNSGNFRKKHCL